MLLKLPECFSASIAAVPAACPSCIMVRERRQLEAAIWITGPVFRLKDKKHDELGAVVVRHARQLSSRLGCNENIAPKPVKK